MSDAMDLADTSRTRGDLFQPSLAPLGILGAVFLIIGIVLVTRWLARRVRDNKPVNSTQTTKP